MVTGGQWDILDQLVCVCVCHGRLTRVGEGGDALFTRHRCGHRAQVSFWSC